MTGRRIAVAGSGVAGLTAAYLLSQGGDAVTLFEAGARLGGHADTHTVTGPDGRELAIDTGFIVHNERTYPLLTRLFGELGVATQPAEMSMSVRCDGCGLAYAGGRGPGGLLAGIPSGRGRYLRMLTEVRAFHRAARRLLAAGDDGPALGQFLDTGGYSAYFIAHFAAPFVAAVWSCPPQTALSYPARYLFTFLANHGLLSVTRSPRWRTVCGGSQVYVRRIAARLAEVRTSAPVRAVRRFTGGVEIRDHDDRARVFDAIVIATHPDQALRLLADPTPAEKEVLGAFGYTANPAVLHTDPRLLPAGRRVRASWNCELTSCHPADAGQVQISYYASRLQRLPGGQDYVISLNPGRRVAPEHVLARMDYAHPVYTRESVAAQRRLPGLTTAVTAYAGAYHGWGFHEDGCRAGVAAARALGSSW